HRIRRRGLDNARPANRVGTKSEVRLKPGIRRLRQTSGDEELLDVPDRRLHIADRRLQIADYCRQIETYLCRKNDGHLIRVVGPAFDLVTGWAMHGVPLRVAFSGIDRCFDRYHRKGSRRRPLHIAFCEADVLDAFDEWRRAVGLPAHLASESAPDEDATQHQQKPSASLAGHLSRAVMR